MKPIVKEYKLKYEGKRFKNNSGDYYTIIEYNNSNDVRIKFDGSEEIKKVRLAHVHSGSISSVIINQKKKYEGKTFKTSDGLEFTVIKYKNNENVKIKFKETGCIRENICLKDILNGIVKDPLNKNVYDRGCIGIGKYSFATHTEIYSAWASIIEYTYITKLENYPSSICEEWLNFQNFAEWYEQNQYPCDEELMLCLNLAKNKCASKDNVAFLPVKFKGTFRASSSRKVSELPRGVYYNKRAKKYTSEIKFNGNRKRLGYFDTIADAYKAYQNERQEFYNKMIIEYKDKLPENVYKILSDININEF